MPITCKKGEIVVGAKLIVLGGPAMNIGLGGGAASSMASGQSDADLGRLRAARQPEMERRCEEVIDRCWQLGDANLILFIHDVGAGGLSNAMPELVASGGRGRRFNLRDILGDRPGMSPLEIWCNNPGALRAGGLLPTSCRCLTSCAAASARRMPSSVKRPKSSTFLKRHPFDNQPIDLPLDVLPR